MHNASGGKIEALEKRTEDKDRGEDATIRMREEPILQLNNGMEVSQVITACMWCVE